ncbi:MAG TPA: bifunctional diaminohydroxyphosphoribosylaminopyrimidine deaminase/5-amino-6-(5-phosphoribosylamino)uracil reductase RibD [Gammaproteobacteria bacterium]|nr:bifunctional diaminohydroxyphosphoribosylaminopyrimidine deaminase/5-amino-6-(5-phosphoribosylamino)uracil reductase RibD [Gammaproteobacteria bacterium]
MSEFNAADHGYMAEALRLAELGLYTTDPNPRVGAVVVKDGEVVGRGFHARAGEAHAEVLAMKEAGAAAKGADLYLTLEPCSHQGKTPPCAEAVIAAGIKRVVAAMTDPNPQVSGKGFEKLKAAGIATAQGLMEADARALNPGFISRMTRGRPWVRSKLAVSLDGRTALATGESKWISGETSREDVHRWRARSSAVLTGIGTLLKDDPSLNVRLPGEWRQPIKVVVDSYLSTPPDAKILKQQPDSVFIATTVEDPEEQELLARAGANIQAFPAKGGGMMDLKAVLETLAELECNEVLVEAGAGMNGPLLAAGLIDEIILYMAPHLLGDTARGMFSLPTLASMEQRRQVDIVDMRMIGKDIRLILRPKQD